MLIINLYRYLFGYVNIMFYGDFPERLLNLMSHSSIYPWNIKRSENKIYCSVLNRDFFKLFLIRKKCGIKIKIIKKFGIYKFFKRFRLRIGIFVGVCIFFALQIILSRFIWRVEIIGNTDISQQKIEAVCEKLNIKAGAYIKDLDLSEIKQKLLLSLPDAAWGAVNIEGCKATVNLSTNPPSGYNPQPANLISDYAGTIKSITVNKGQAVVKTGDAVSVGDLLISGANDYQNRIEFVRPSGNVVCSVNDYIKIFKPYKADNKIYTHTSKKVLLEFFSLKIPLYLGETKGEFESQYNKRTCRLLGAEMPVVIHSRDYRHFYTVSNLKSDAQLLKCIEAEFAKQMAQLEAENLKITSRDISRTDNGISVVFSVSFDKKIGVYENISFADNN